MHRRVIPTAYLWGRKDPAFGEVATTHTVEQLRRRAGDRPELAITRELDAGHWLPEREAGRVAYAIADRISSVTAS